MSVPKLSKVLIIGFIGALLFVLYSLLPLSQFTDGLVRSVSLKFDTPDEMINYTFALNVAEKSSLYYIDLVNVYLPESIVFPRWARPQDGFMYPGTFWGLIIIFGSVAKMFGKVVIPFLTPLCALGCVGLMYGIVRRVLGKDVARWSAILLALFPVFVYYASRTMFHTVLFIFFLLLGVWLYLRSFDDNRAEEARSTKHEVRSNSETQNPKLEIFKTSLIRVLNSFRISNFEFRISYYLSALSFGLALFVRFADAGLILLTIIALMMWKRIDAKRILLFICIFALSLTPMFILNHISYGSPLDFGHNGGNVIEVAEGVVAQGSIVRQLVSFVLPFGFHPRVMWSVVLNVLLKPYWWFWILAVTGYWVFVKRYWNDHRREIALFTLYSLLFTLYLISLYGSWSFSDSVVPNAFTISSSYYRYFLPLFVLAVPFVGYAIFKTIRYVIANGRTSWEEVVERSVACLDLRLARRAISNVAHRQNESVRPDGSTSGMTSSSLAMTINCSLSMLVVGLLAFLTFNYAYLGNEGLFHVRRQVLSYRQIALEAKKVTNQEDVILVKRGEDKMIFPDRYHVVNVDYIPHETIERTLKSFKGTVWEIRAGKFVKVK